MLDSDGVVLLLLVPVLAGAIWWALTRSKPPTEWLGAFASRLGITVLPPHPAAGLLLAFDRPTWGGVLQLIPTGEGAFATARFLGVTVRENPALVVATRGWSKALVSVDRVALPVEIGDEGFDRRYGVRAASQKVARDIVDPGARAIVERLNPAVEHPREGSHPGICLSSAGTMVGLLLSGQTASDEEHLTRLVTLIESFVDGLQRNGRSAAAKTCHGCGTPLDGDPVACDACGARYHEGCWGQHAMCRKWGCGEKQALLDSLSHVLWADPIKPGAAATGGRISLNPPPSSR